MFNGVVFQVDPVVDADNLPAVGAVVDGVFPLVENEGETATTAKRKNLNMAISTLLAENIIYNDFLWGSQHQLSAACCGLKGQRVAMQGYRGTSFFHGCIISSFL